jgi:hypothetical protein
MIIAWTDWEEPDLRDAAGRTKGSESPRLAVAVGDPVDDILRRLFKPVPGYSEEEWQNYVVGELKGAARRAGADNPPAAASLRHLAALRAAHDEPYREATPTAEDGRRYDWQLFLIRDAAPRLVAEGPGRDHGRAA